MRYNLLTTLIAGIKDPVGAEIGVADGIFSENILESNPGLQLFCIDPYKMYQADYGTGVLQHNYKTQKDFDDQYLKTEKKLSVFDNRVTLMRKSSVVAANILGNNCFDFVFIDANHLFAHVYEDITAWWHNVKPGGIISGHDYNKNDPNHLVNTCNAVDMLFTKNELNFARDSCWWTIKKKEQYETWLHNGFQ